MQVYYFIVYFVNLSSVAGINSSIYLNYFFTYSKTRFVDHYRRNMRIIGYYFVCKIMHNEKCPHSASAFFIKSVTVNEVLSNHGLTSLKFHLYARKNHLKILRFESISQEVVVFLEVIFLL